MPFSSLMAKKHQTGHKLIERVPSFNPLFKGAVHIMGEICPRSDPDIAHMGYCLDPIKFVYRTLLVYGHQGARF